VAEYDKSGWTTYEPAECECVGARIASSRINGSIKPTFILEMYVPELELTAIKWLNVTKTPKGSYSVKQNSDFAKLYRLTIGYVNKRRFSKAHQLKNHIVGHQFIADFKQDKGADGDNYLKVTAIKPLNPIITDGWFPDGRIRDKNWKQNGNGLETNWKQTGNGLETPKAVNPHLNLVSPAISTTLKDITSKIDTYKDTVPTPVVNDEYETVLEIVNGMKTFQYHQHPNETLAEYHERVIAESFIT
jgi:hypothetical protein